MTQALFDADTSGKIIVTKEVLNNELPNTDDFVDKSGDTMTGLLQTPVVQEGSNEQINNALNFEFFVNWSFFNNYDFTLTANGEIKQSNIPPSGYAQTITIYVKGDFALTLPTEWIVIGGVYDPNGTQFIVQSWDDGNFYCAIGGGEIDLSNYLQKSGGTMSGALTINKDLLALYLPDGGLSVGSISPVSKVEVDYSTSLPNNINSDVNSWNNDGKSSFSIKGNNNRMAFGVDGTQNTRVGFIQVGHSSNAFANLTDSKLLLQPYGGNVGIGTTDPQEKLEVDGTIRLTNIQVFADNTSASSLPTGTIYRTSDGTLKIKY